MSKRERNRQKSTKINSNNQNDLKSQKIDYKVQKTNQKDQKTKRKATKGAENGVAIL